MGERSVSPTRIEWQESPYRPSSTDFHVPSAGAKSERRPSASFLPPPPPGPCARFQSQELSGSSAMVDMPGNSLQSGFSSGLGSTLDQGIPDADAGQAPYLRWQTAIQGPASGSSSPLPSSSATTNATIDQKLTALSRRTAAEMRRAEKERNDLARRLEVLEELCRQHIGGLDVRFSRARDEAAQETDKIGQRIRKSFEKDLKAALEAMEQQQADAQASDQKQQEVWRGFGRRMDAAHTGLEELRAWRRTAEEQLSTLYSEDRGALASSSTRPIAGLEELVEEQLEGVLSRERKQAHERLRSSCAELTAHLNDLRRELVEQRKGAEQTSERVESRREKMHRELSARLIDLETQIADLGGALATRLQAKVSSITSTLNDRIEEVRDEQCGQKDHNSLKDRVALVEKSLENSEQWLSGQVQMWRKENAELHNSVVSLQGPAQRESSQLLDVVRDEARTVHLEVMSIDTRVAALEDRLADSPGRRRYEAMLITKNLGSGNGMSQRSLG